MRQVVCIAEAEVSVFLRDRPSRALHWLRRKRALDSRSASFPLATHIEEDEGADGSEAEAPADVDRAPGVENAQLDIGLLDGDGQAERDEGSVEDGVESGGAPARPRERGTAASANARTRGSVRIR